MYIYTIIITFCRVGAIWTKNIILRKTFQSASTIVLMIAIIEVAKKKNKIQESYDRKTDRKLYAESKNRT
jgi:hypothetical protein